MAAEVQQYTFSHKELVELMVKALGVHEGRWWIALTVGLAPGNFGPSQEEMSPGVVVAINRIGIQRVIESAPPPPEVLTVDAAQVNPKETAKP